MSNLETTMGQPTKKSSKNVMADAKQLNAAVINAQNAIKEQALKAQEESLKMQQAGLMAQQMSSTAAISQLALSNQQQLMANQEKNRKEIFDLAMYLTNLKSEAQNAGMQAMNMPANFGNPSMSGLPPLPPQGNLPPMSSGGMNPNEMPPTNAPQPSAGYV